MLTVVKTLLSDAWELSFNILWCFGPGSRINGQYLDSRDLTGALKNELAPLLQDMEDGLTEEMNTLLWNKPCHTAHLQKTISPPK